MIYLAPNVYVLDYLMNTKQLSGANEENAYRFIQSGICSLTTVVFEAGKRDRELHHDSFIVY